MVTTYGKNLIMDNLFQTPSASSLPTQYWIGLSTTEPTVSGTNFSEPASGTGYARKQISGLAASTGGVVTNGTILSFAESTASQGTITHYGLFDASTDGHLIMYGQLEKSRIVEEETTLSLKAGALTLSLVDA